MNYETNEAETTRELPTYNPAYQSAAAPRHASDGEVTRKRPARWPFGAACASMLLGTLLGVSACAGPPPAPGANLDPEAPPATVSAPASSTLASPASVTPSAAPTVVVTPSAPASTMPATTKPTTAKPDPKTTTQPPVTIQVPQATTTTKAPPPPAPPVTTTQPPAPPVTTTQAPPPPVEQSVAIIGRTVNPNGTYYIQVRATGHPSSVTLHCGTGSDTLTAFGSGIDPSNGFDLNGWADDTFWPSWLQGFGCTDINMFTATVG